MEQAPLCGSIELRNRVGSSRFPSRSATLPHNNFHLVRLFAALMVLYSHAHTLAGLPEPLFLGYLPLGPVAVYIFFALSGNLVYQSFAADPHLGRFLVRRALRLFPALIVVTLLAILALGPLVSSLPADAYFANPATRFHLWNVALYPVYFLPGVFTEHHVANAVNGSLWSLPIEFLMYLSVPLSLGSRGLARIWFALIFVVFAVLHFTWVWPSTELSVFWGSDLRQVAMCGIFFAAGALIRACDLERYLKLDLLTGAGVLLLCGTIGHHAFFSAMWITLPLLVLGFGSSSNAIGRFIASRGDYSYGIYLYAFPVQQTLLWWQPGMAFWPFLLGTIAITVALAALSWHLIEQPALRFKPRAPGSVARVSAAHPR